MVKVPTTEQCGANEKVFEDDTKVGYAIWYPQIGGYVGRAVVFLDKQWSELPNGSRTGGCFDVLVWHDGEFPFGDTSDGPRMLHHCDPEQFISFGKKVMEMNERGRMKGD